MRIACAGCAELEEKTKKGKNLNPTATYAKYIYKVLVREYLQFFLNSFISKYAFQLNFIVDAGNAGWLESVVNKYNEL